MPLGLQDRGRGREGAREGPAHLAGRPVLPVDLQDPEDRSRALGHVPATGQEGSRSCRGTLPKAIWPSPHGARPLLVPLPLAVTHLTDNDRDPAPLPASHGLVATSPASPHFLFHGTFWSGTKGTRQSMTGKLGRGEDLSRSFQLPPFCCLAGRAGCPGPAPSPREEK